MTYPKLSFDARESVCCRALGVGSDAFSTFVRHAPSTLTSMMLWSAMTDVAVVRVESVQNIRKTSKGLAMPANSFRCAHEAFGGRGRVVRVGVRSSGKLEHPGRLEHPEGSNIWMTTEGLAGE